MNSEEPNDAPMWTKFYSNEPLVSIRQCVSERRGGAPDNAHLKDLATFVQEAWDEMPQWPVLLETTKRWNDAPCKVMITNISWLEAFTGGSSSMDPALGALDSSANHCTRLLLRFLILLDNHAIMEEWKLQALDIIKNCETQCRLPLNDYKAISITRFIQWQCERDGTIIPPLWKSLQQAVQKAVSHRDNEISSSKVANFCMLAGCPSVEKNPTRNIWKLRTHLLSRPSAGREAELRREIGALKSEIQMQQRIISNLTFRHLLENLPPASTKKMSSTARWTDFFKHAIQISKFRSASMSPPHPLDALLCKYGDVNQVERVGIGLYSTFSTNIHYFNSQYTVAESQWNALEYDIMKALVPASSNITADGIDWQKERERYRAV